MEVSRSNFHGLAFFRYCRFATVERSFGVRWAYLASTAIVLPGTCTWPFATDSGDVEARPFST